MTSSTKLEVHNGLHCPQGRTETGHRLHKENFVKFGHVIFVIRKWMDRETDKDVVLVWWLTDIVYVNA